MRNRPPPSSRPPQSPHPPPLSVPDDDPQQLYPLFRAANTSHSGALTELELGSALVNGDYTSFHPKTVKMMIRMFDRNSSGTISFDEFVSLWRYLAAWRELFDRFDVDRSGRISLPEFENALVAFGYRLSPGFVQVMFITFESKGRQMNGHTYGKHGMSFDLFVQACISLRRMTDVFKRYDDDRDGYITVSFEEFLTGECARSPPRRQKKKSGIATDRLLTRVCDMLPCCRDSSVTGLDGRRGVGGVFIVKVEMIDYRTLFMMCPSLYIIYPIYFSSSGIHGHGDRGGVG